MAGCFPSFQRLLVLAFQRSKNLDCRLGHHCRERDLTSFDVFEAERFCRVMCHQDRLSLVDWSLFSCSLQRELPIPVDRAAKRFDTVTAVLRGGGGGGAHRVGVESSHLLRTLPFFPLGNNNSTESAGASGTGASFE
jgi:hypothetical protein